MSSVKAFDSRSLSVEIRVLQSTKQEKIVIEMGTYRFGSAEPTDRILKSDMFADLWTQRDCPRTHGSFHGSFEIQNMVVFLRHISEFFYVLCVFI